MKKIKIIPMALTAIMLVSIFASMSLAANLSSVDEIREDASVILYSNDGLITVRLTRYGENYKDGYDDYEILVNGENVQDLPEKFVLGEKISIGNDKGFIVDGNPLSQNSEYKVTVIILGTIIFDRAVTIQ